jgi:hypothetical protein
MPAASRWRRSTTLRWRAGTIKTGVLTITLAVLNIVGK